MSLALHRNVGAFVKSTKGINPANAAAGAINGPAIDRRGYLSCVLQLRGDRLRGRRAGGGDGDARRQGRAAGLRRRRMSVIRFTMRQSPYQAGDRAGFPDEVAERYVAAGVAEPLALAATGHPATGDAMPFVTQAEPPASAAEANGAKVRRSRRAVIRTRA